MKILYLTNAFPYPLTSGYLRHYFLIKELAPRHAITLLSVVGGKFNAEHLKALQPYTDCIYTFTSKTKGQPIAQKIIHRAIGLVRGDSAILQMRQMLKKLLAQDRYDALMLTGKHTYAAIADLETPPIIADMCDATSVRLRGTLTYASPIKRLPVWVEYQQVKQIERGILNRSEHVLFASLRDCEALAHDRPATIVPNGVDVDYWRRSSPQLGKNTLIFTGAMNYPPNADAARYLIKTILPLVQKTVPDVRVLIVGHSPPPDLVELGKHPSVTVTGFVDDMRPYLEQATVFVAPLRFGAGIQNKVLEAMAMELPIVASAVAAEGLRTEAGDCPFIETADTAEQYAALICKRLAEAPTPAAGAREYVETNFVWKRSGELLNRILETVTQRR
ncbi:MAG TPA: glycosyltransferase [Oceanobacillus sp.]|nr:glycosyltransferase [Oceanobacillus sp.]